MDFYYFYYLFSLSSHCFLLQSNFFCFFFQLLPSTIRVWGHLFIWGQLLIIFCWCNTILLSAFNILLSSQMVNSTLVNEHLLFCQPSFLVVVASQGFTKPFSIFSFLWPFYGLLWMPRIKVWRGRSDILSAWKARRQLGIICNFLRFTSRDLI